MASLYVGLDIFVMKIGGDVAGGIHYESHTWEELIDNIPEFSIFFAVTFIGTFVYNSLSKAKNLICPNCEHAFISYKAIMESKCPKCSSFGEKSEGFHERHPEFKKQ